MTTVVERPHPVVRCLAAMGAALDEASDVDAAWMSAEDKRTALLGLTILAARAEELRLRVLGAGQALGDVAADEGARDAASWLAHHARLDGGHARRLTRLARSLDRWSRVAAALRHGAIDPVRAEVVVSALEELPDDLDRDVLDRAEEVLVEQATEFDPRRLRVLGRRVLAHVAPEIASAHEERLLADEDARAEATTFLRTRRRRDGTTEIHARVADLVADRLLTYLHAFTSPRQHGSPGAEAPGGGQRGAGQPGTAPPGAARPGDGPGTAAPADRRPHDRRLGTAFGALLETWDPDRLPVHGGDATTVVVTINIDDLTGRLTDQGVALVGDQPLTAAQARRLACTAGVLPAVLGGDSQVLDLGRSRRLFSPSQRKALALRHPTCGASGCDIPAPWCEAHHAGLPWAAGGRTDLLEGVLLCSHHHHRAHDPRYEVTRHPDGSLRYYRRC